MIVLRWLYFAATVPLRPTGHKLPKIIHARKALVRLGPVEKDRQETRHLANHSVTLYMLQTEPA